MPQNAHCIRSSLLAEVAQRLAWSNDWAYDGRATLYGIRDLLRDTRLGETRELTLRRPDRRGRAADEEEEFTVRIRALGGVHVAEAVTQFFASPGQLLPAEALAVLDCVTSHRRALQAEHWTVVGRSFLNRGDTRPLGAGLEVWLGYSATTRPAQPGAGAGTGAPALLSLVVDRAAAAFVKAQPVMQLVYEVSNGASPPWDERTWRRVNKALRGLKARPICVHIGCGCHVHALPRLLTAAWRCVCV
jgi:hypothetical protein